MIFGQNKYASQERVDFDEIINGNILEQFEIEIGYFISTFSLSFHFFIHYIMFLHYLNETFHSGCINVSESRFCSQFPFHSKFQLFVLVED